MGTALMGKEIGRGRRERPKEVGRRGWRARKIAETGDGKIAQPSNRPPSQKPSTCPATFLKTKIKRPNRV